MKPSSWLILFVMITSASYYYHQRSQTNSAPALKEVALEKPSSTPTAVTPSSSTAITKTPISVQPRTTMAATKVPVQTGHQKWERYTQKPKDMNVEFQVIDGMAVAYGDEVLGKPMNGFAEQNGITEVRPPRYWDHGIIPYVIKEDVVNPSRIKEAIDFFNVHTSVQFVPYDNQPDAIVFVKGDKNCLSYLGRTGGLQPVYLSERCGPPEIEHELMHALGFVHEQSRVDRDQFIEILWDNIEEKYQDQFAMVPEPFMESYFDSPFDVHSIMMYEPHMFATKPELETMKMKSGASLPQYIATMSPSDIERVARLYPK